MATNKPTHADRREKFEKANTCFRRFIEMARRVRA